MNRVLVGIAGLMMAGAAGVYARSPAGAAGCLAVGCGAGGAAVAGRSAGALAGRVKAASAGGKLARIDRGRGGAAAVADAVNAVIDVADAGVSAAKLRAKELEIQWKVAAAERDHAESIIYSISDAVLVTDPFDELLMANESAARAFGFEAKAEHRCPIADVLTDGKLIDLIRETRQSHSRGGRRIVEHRVRTPAGERVYKVTLSCVSDGVDGDHSEADRAAGVVAVLHDMTREKEVAEMKNDFVSNVSHELRTPLASIRAYVEMLVDGEATDDRTRQEFYEIIQAEANRLGRLIDNILNVSRIESGLVKVNKGPQSVAVIVKEATGVIAPQAKGKRIDLVERLAPVLYRTMADRDMLYQAVLNLLSNAVKYTPEGGRITVENVVDEAAGTVLTKVTDTGVGIPPKDLPFVFDKFYRVEANNHMAKGTGLGLSLVKHVVETVHKGRLFVESHVGQGTTFGFELRLCE